MLALIPHDLGPVQPPAPRQGRAQALPGQPGIIGLLGSLWAAWERMPGLSLCGPSLHKPILCYRLFFIPRT